MSASTERAVRRDGTKALPLGATRRSWKAVDALAVGPAELSALGALPYESA